MSELRVASYQSLKKRLLLGMPSQSKQVRLCDIKTTNFSPWPAIFATRARSVPEKIPLASQTAVTKASLTEMLQQDPIAVTTIRRLTPFRFPLR